jgi:hypothetical protein
MILTGNFGGASAGAQCQGDFNRDGAVAINEIMTSVNNSLTGCPSPGARFVDNGDGTITDGQTGLMWPPNRAQDF